MTRPLSSFHPAEVHLLLEQTDASNRELLRLTMLDLVERNILSFKRNNDMSEDETGFLYVRTGEEYKTYSARHFESPLLLPFHKDAELRILFKHYVKLIWQYSGDGTYIRAMLLRDKKLQVFFRSNWWKRIWGKVVLSETGEHQRALLQNEIADLRHRLRESEENDLAVLRERWGALLFLSGLEAHGIDDYYEAQLKKYWQQSYTPDSGCYSDLKTYDEAFNAAASEAESTSSGGEGDDGGCGGCGGCGD